MIDVLPFVPNASPYSKIGSISGVKAGGVPGVEVVRAFADAPAVVAAAEPRRLVVDLLAGALADVADQHRAGAAQPGRVEGEAPRVAQAERPDLVERAAASADAPTNGLSAGMR